MNNHSVSAQRDQRTNALLRAGMTLEQIKARYSSEPKRSDGIYSPILQLWVTGIVSCIGGLWFCMLVSLNEDNELRKTYVDIGSILLFWIIVIELILFLWKILK